MTLHRRSFIQSSIALGASVLLDPRRPVRAASTCSRTRFSATSTQGKDMLAIYADAVGKMMDASKFPQSDPRSWLFQWYTHSVPNFQKTAELNRVFPNGQPAAFRQLAGQMWETCQAHHGEREDFFLPWHRMYVACFEDIIRFASGKDCFTLPYWDYTNKNEHSLPQEFLKKGDPVWGSLYRENRWQSVNGGGDVTQSEGGGGDLNLDCMKSPGYSVINGVAGFCRNLDNAPHGALHGDVGNDRGMGQVPWAANDPIFWLHHCNVDRIWASWNKAGGKNPGDADFLKTPFTFALPSGAAATRFVRDVLIVPTDSYDAYLSRPPGSVPFPTGHAPEGELLSVHADSAPQTSGPVRLNGGPVTVTLATQRATAPRAPSDTRFSAQLDSLDIKAPLYLALDGLSASGPVQGVFDIYVHGKEKPTLDKAQAAHVGQINFFASSGMQMATPPSGAGPSASFVLTSQTRAYLQKLSMDEPQVTFVPTRKITDSAAPSVARIRLLAS
jgi:tyrosinase